MHWYEMSWTGQSVETDSKLRFAKGWGCRRWGVSANGQEVTPDGMWCPNVSLQWWLCNSINILQNYGILHFKWYGILWDVNYMSSKLLKKFFFTKILKRSFYSCQWKWFFVSLSSFTSFPSPTFCWAPSHYDPMGYFLLRSTCAQFKNCREYWKV